MLFSLLESLEQSSIDLVLVKNSLRSLFPHQARAELVRTHACVDVRQLRPRRRCPHRAHRLEGSTTGEVHGCVEWELHIETIVNRYERHLLHEIWKRAIPISELIQGERMMLLTYESH
jgi:hypothetical protein